MSKLKPISNTPLSVPKPRAKSSTDSRLGEKLRLERLAPTWTGASPKPLSTRLRTTSPTSRRGLCYDIENKPGTYGPGDYTHPKVTAVGCSYLDSEEVLAWCLDRDDREGMRQGAEEFRILWDAADFVVGHNIRRHDRKILDGLYTALDLEHLAPKRMVDTYLDQPKMAGLSRSLENLASRWGCPIQKMGLSEYDWERAYDGTPEGVELMRQRVTTDVQINIWLFHELVERGLLRWK
jgi:hypothetical protein